MILSERVPYKLSVWTLFTIGLLALLALPGWSLAQAVAPPKIEDGPANVTPKVTPADPLQASSDKAIATATIDAPPTVEPTLQSSTLGTRTDYVEVPVLVQATADDQRIEALEKKLELLIEEVRGLRSSRNAPAGSPASSIQPTLPYAAGKAATPAPRLRAVTVDTVRTLTDHAARLDTDAGSNVQMLSRATYKLSKEKAEALAAFLREHMKSPVEAKVEDDSLIVTASPEAQATIGQFIAMSEGKQPAAARKLYSQQSQQPGQYGIQAAPSKPGRVPSAVTEPATPADAPAPNDLGKKQ